MYSPVEVFQNSTCSISDANLVHFYNLVGIVLFVVIWEVDYFLLYFVAELMIVGFLQSVEIFLACSLR